VHEGVGGCGGVLFKTVSSTQLLVVKQVAYFLTISAAINFSNKLCSMQWVILSN